MQTYGKIKQQLPAGERLDLIRQVFERCKRLKLQAPLLSDLDDYLDGKISVMPPVVDEKSNGEVQRGGASAGTRG
jgi:hypothetical protein